MVPGFEHIHRAASFGCGTFHAPFLPRTRLVVHHFKTLHSLGPTLQLIKTEYGARRPPRLFARDDVFEQNAISPDTIRTDSRTDSYIRSVPALTKQAAYKGSTEALAIKAWRAWACETWAQPPTSSLITTAPATAPTVYALR